MKSHFVVALLLATMPAYADTIKTLDSHGDMEIIETSSTGITVTSRYYQPKQSVPGSYEINGVRGKAKFIGAAKGGSFTINDPALAKAVASRKDAVVITFETEPQDARQPGIVNIALPDPL